MNRLFPYSTSHYHCGCHVVEDRLHQRVDLMESIFCSDADEELNSRTYVECLYVPVLHWRRVQASKGAH